MPEAGAVNGLVVMVTVRARPHWFVTVRARAHWFVTGRARAHWFVTVIAETIFV